MKKCVSCQKENQEEFFIGRHCSACYEERIKIKQLFPDDYNAYTRAWKQAKKRLGHCDPNNNKKRYESKCAPSRFALGVNHEQYLLMVRTQNNTCPICLNLLGSGKQVHLDHCHSTGAIREILCRDCNLGLGRFKDNTESLLRAIQYLIKPR